MIHEAKTKIANGKTEYIFRLECPHCKGSSTHSFSQVQIQKEWPKSEFWSSPIPSFIDCSLCNKKIPVKFLTSWGRPNIEILPLPE